MCGRITILTYDEVRDIARAVQAGETARLHDIETRTQARPSTTLPLIGTRNAQPTIFDATWGIEAPWNNKLVYNTRIESALGGSSMWAKPIREGRCILPAATFFEPHGTQTIPSPRTGQPIKQNYEFEMPDKMPLLLASVYDDGRFSIVTTEPNAAVSPVHPRMPLALRFEEVPLWLEGDLSEIAALADRSHLALDVQAEKLEMPAKPSSIIDEAQLSLF